LNLIDENYITIELGESTLLSYKMMLYSLWVWSCNHYCF